MRTLASIALICLAAFSVSSAQYDLSELDQQSLKSTNAIIHTEKIRFDVESDDKATLYVNKVISILSKEYDFDGVYAFYNSDREVRSIKARILNAQGVEVWKSKRSDIEDHKRFEGSLYSDSRYKFISIKHNTYPYTVEYTYELDYEGIQYYPDWNLNDYNVAVESSVFEIVVPENIQIDYKSIRVEPEYSKTMEEDRVVHTWAIKKLESIESARYCPDILPSIWISPSLINIQNYSGSYSDWEKFGAFLCKINTDKISVPGPLEKEILNLTESCATDKEKIEVLYNYLQDQTRYVSVQIGIGGWQTYDANYVYENKYGDCKALSNYMKSLLNIVGIHSNLVVISNGKVPNLIFPDFVHPNMNHMVLYVPDHNMWLECTSKSYPPGYIGSSNENRSALMLASGKGKLVETVGRAASENLKSTKISISLNENGSASFKYRVKAVNKPHEVYRYLINYLESSDADDYLIHTFPKITIQQISTNKITTSESEPLAQGISEFTTTSFGSKQGNRFFIPAIPQEFDIPKLEIDSSRKHPIQIALNESLVDTITIEIPQRFEIESIFSDIDINSEYGAYTLHSKYVKEENLLQISRSCVLENIDSKPQAYNDIRRFFQSIKKADNSSIVLRKMKT